MVLAARPSGGFARGVISTARGGIYSRCACYAAASIAHGYASVTAASCALEAHETCLAGLACRANGFGCAFYGSLNAPNVADVGCQAEHLQSELKFYALNLWRLVMKQS